MDLYEKTAVWGALARGVSRGAYNFGKGFMGLGPSAKAGVIGKGLNMAGTATMMAAPFLGSINPSNRDGPSVGVPGFPGFGKFNSLDERLTRLVKHAFDLHSIDIPRAVNTASYGAFLASQLVPHDSRWHKPLEIAGLLGLTGTSLHDISQGKPIGYFDTAGLGLMGAGMLHEHLTGGGHSP